jgi:hypothetical protein
MIHSGRSSEWIDTRSPVSTPSASSPWAASTTRFQVRSHVYSRQMPKSFSRIATRCGARWAQSRASEATVVAVVAAVVRSSGMTTAIECPLSTHAPLA